MIHPLPSLPSVISLVLVFRRTRSLNISRDNPLNSISLMNAQSLACDDDKGRFIVRCGALDHRRRRLFRRRRRVKRLLPCSKLRSLRRG